MNNEIEQFCKKIDELRTILNEMSISLLNDEMENNIEIIRVSKELDVLIVKYYLLKLLVENNRE